MKKFQAFISKNNPLSPESAIFTKRKDKQIPYVLVPTCLSSYLLASGTTILAGRNHFRVCYRNSCQFDTVGVHMAFDTFEDINDEDYTDVFESEDNLGATVNEILNEYIKQSDDELLSQFSVMLGHCCK